MSFIEETPRYNITIYKGTDYEMDLGLILEDDSDLDNYGALIYNGVLRDGTESEIDGNVWVLSDDWIISDNKVIYVGSDDVVVGSWLLEAHLREYKEASDYYEFDINVDTDGYKLTMDHDTTERIPFVHGVYDVKITNVDTGKISVLIYGEAEIVGGPTR